MALGACVGPGSGAQRVRAGGVEWGEEAPVCPSASSCWALLAPTAYRRLFPTCPAALGGGRNVLERGLGNAGRWPLHGGWGRRKTGGPKGYRDPWWRYSLLQPAGSVLSLGIVTSASCCILCLPQSLPPPAWPGLPKDLAFAESRSPVCLRPLWDLGRLSLEHLWPACLVSA